MKEVVVVGLGLIGGSLALALQRNGIRVRATDADPSQVAQARKAGVAAVENLTDTLAASIPDAVVICTPVSSIAAVFREYRRVMLGRETFYFHAGGLQTAAHLGVAASDSQLLVGTHPLAGSHESGFHAAREELFSNCVVMVERKATAEQMKAALEIWSRAGAGRVVVEDAELHDARMTVVNHLPQLASTALALTIRERGYRSAEMGTGGHSATRLAASPFSLWVELLQRSRPDVVPLLARLQWNVGRLREAIAAENWNEVEAIWAEAAELFQPPGESNDGS